jgi:hypothetical protein
MTLFHTELQNRTLLILYSSEDTYSSLAVGDVVVVGVGRRGHVVIYDSWLHIK